MFWNALAWALLSGFVVRYLLLVLYMPTTLLGVVIAKRVEYGEPTTLNQVLFWLWLPVSLSYSYYIMTAWGVWCAYGGLAFALDPATTNAWFYYLIAFGLCAAVVGGMVGNDHNPGFASVSSCYVALISCILFMIFPTWIPPLHWWWLQYARLLYGG